jgi:hypothetical protein
LLCPQCHKEIRIVALIDEAAVIERILRHLGLWEVGMRVDAALAARISSQPARRTRHFVVRGAPRTTKWPAFISQSPIWQRLGVDITASSFKLRTNVPEGRKRFPISVGKKGKGQAGFLLHPGDHGKKPPRSVVGAVGEEKHRHQSLEDEAGKNIRTGRRDDRPLDGLPFHRLFAARKARVPRKNSDFA